MSLAQEHTGNKVLVDFHRLVVVVYVAKEQQNRLSVGLFLRNKKNLLLLRDDNWV